MTQTKDLLTGLSIVSDTKQSQANTVFIKVADVLSIERHKSRVHSESARSPDDHESTLLQHDQSLELQEGEGYLLRHEIS